MRIAEAALAMAEELGARRAARARPHDDRHRRSVAWVTASGDEGHGASSRDRSRDRLATSRPRSSTTSPSSAFIDGRPRRARTSSTPRRCVSLERFGDGASVRFVRGKPHLRRRHAGRLGPRHWRSADAFIAECEAGSPHTQEAHRTHRPRDHPRGRAETPTAPSLITFEAIEVAREAEDLCPARRRSRQVSRAHMPSADELDEAHHIVEELVPARSEARARTERSHELGALRGRLGVDDELTRGPRGSAVPEVPVDPDAAPRLGRRLRRGGRRLRDDGKPDASKRACASEQESGCVAGRERGGATSSSGRSTFYRSVGATYFVRRGEALLAESA